MLVQGGTLSGRVKRKCKLYSTTASRQNADTERPVLPKSAKHQRITVLQCVENDGKDKCAPIMVEK
jgi:hypothetical protein